MIALTDDLLESLREPPGTPCRRCGLVERHEHGHWRKTPKRWAVRVTTHWQSDSGIWWMAVGAPRYVETEERARELAASHERRVVER